jgi:hypothetical protein
MLVLTALFSRKYFKECENGFLVMILEVVAILVFAFVTGENSLLSMLRCAHEYVVPVVVSGFIGMCIVFNNH